MHKKLTKSPDIFNTRGILLISEAMWRHTTFMVGGPADLYAVPEDENDLRILLRDARREGIEVFTLGGGSNLLVSDKGIRGLVINTRLFNEYHVEDRTERNRDIIDAATGPREAAVSAQRLVLGAGLAISDAAWKSGSEGFTGLDNFFAMPGSVGGAVWMNARCYDREIADNLAWVEVMDAKGRVSRLEMIREEWAYKKSPFQNSDGIILRAAFDVNEDRPEALRESMRDKRNDRESKGHFRAPCAGSAFKNNRDFGVPSGVLIDNTGLKGLRKGAAAISDWHGNILINDGGARASEIRELLDEVAFKVKEATGFEMEAEVRSIGDWKY